MGAAARRRAEHRARLEHAWDEDAEADRLWFEAHPGRTTYIRHATSAEIELHHFKLRWPISAGPGLQYFTLVRQVWSGLRLRICQVNEADARTDLNDEDAAEAWRWIDEDRGGRLVRFEADLRAKHTANGASVH